MDLSSKVKFGVKTTTSLLDVEDTIRHMGDELRELGYDTRTAVVHLDSRRDDDGNYVTHITAYVEADDQTREGEVDV